MDSLLIAFYQLTSNPGRLLIFGLLVAALAMLVRLLSSRSRGWQLRRLTLTQSIVITALLATIFGCCWALTYESTNIQGSIPSYLEGISSILTALFAITSAALCVALLLRSIVRLVAQRSV